MCLHGNDAYLEADELAYMHMTVHKVLKAFESLDRGQQQAAAVINLRYI